MVKNIKWYKNISLLSQRKIPLLYFAILAGGVLFFHISCNKLKADEFPTSIFAYRQIKDIFHPTIDDYWIVQNYLKHGERKEIAWLDDYQAIARNFKIIGNEPDEQPQSGLINVNCNKEERENCLLVYSSFNKNYPRGLNRLVSHVSNSDFIGHILYRLGGWPNVEEGSLRLAHVPYAFKVCFFKEAKRLGYKRALFLDTPIIPLVSLNSIFKSIEEKGYFIMGNFHMVGPYFNRLAARGLGITMDEAANIPSCSAGILGVDFNSRQGLRIIDAWYEAACNNAAFFSPRCDQSALSVILYKMGITDFVNIGKLPHYKKDIQPDSLFLIEKDFVHKN